MSQELLDDNKLILNELEELPDFTHVDVDKFSEAANYFMKTGRYCDYPAGTKEYDRFWDEQERRCAEGFEVDGVYITGRHYGYLNFSQIKTVEEYYVRGKKLHRKTLGFPKFLDMDYQFFHEYDKAKEAGEGMVVAKSRRKGFSYKAAWLNVYEYEFTPDSTCIIGAFEGEYAQTTFNMCREMIDFIDKNTAWVKNRLVNQKDHVKSGYKKTLESGVEVTAGYKSEIYIISFKDDPHKGIGKSATIFNYEEAGKWPGLEVAYGLNYDTMKDGNISIGMALVWGTGGDMDKSTIDFEKLFYKPQDYGLRVYNNVWDEGASGQPCGYFVDDTWYKEPFVTAKGVSQRTAARRDLEAQRDKLRKSGNRKKLEVFITQRPLCPKEAFLQTSGNIFPAGLLQEQLNFITLNKKASKAALKGKLVQRFDDLEFVIDDSLEPASYPYSEDQRESCVLIYEMPIEERPIPHGLYVIGVDPYEHDDTTSDSYGSIFVYKRFLRPTETHDVIVAEYTGRPETAEQFYDIVLKLSLFYGEAKVLYENMYKSIRTHFKIKGYEYLLLDQPEVIRDISKNTLVQRGKGMHMTAPLKRAGEQLIKDWLLEDRGENRMNLHSIQSEGLLIELIKYNQFGNFDRVMAFMMIMYMLKELYHIQVTDQNQENKPAMFDYFLKKYTTPRQSMPGFKPSFLIPPKQD